MYSVRVDLSHVSHFKVAHGYAWKIDRVRGVLSLHYVLYDFETIQMKILVTEQNVQQKELTKRIGEVEDLYEKVQTNKIGAT